MSTAVDAAAVGAPDAYPGMNGRLYALGQMLAREQQRNAALEQQLDQRAHEVDQLRGEVQQLQERAGEPDAPPEAVAAAPRGDDAVPATADPAADLPESAATAPDSTGHTAGEPPVSDGAVGDGTGEDTDAGAPAAEIAALRAALTEEQEQRRAAETQLARLKEETSTPFDQPASATDTALSDAQQEIAALRTALAEERATRERLAADLEALQQRVAEDAARAPEAPPESEELRARLERLQAEQQAAVESFNSTLAASQERIADLERQLAAAAAPANNGDGTSMRAENIALRERLNEEHRRTRELTTKLRLATRVTDLIFKMQAQKPAPDLAAGAPEWMPPLPASEADPWLDR